jgi:hypothetical protein
MAGKQIINGVRSMSDGGEPSAAQAPPVPMPRVATKKKSPTPDSTGPKTHLRLQSIAANYRVVLQGGKRVYTPDGPEDQPGIELQFRNHLLTLEDPSIIALAEKNPHFGPGREFWDADALAEELRSRQDDELIAMLAARPELLERARALAVKPDAEDLPSPDSNKS